jgi:SAM-dependent methyltransferase
VVDVGGVPGALLRHLGPRPHFAAIELAATDIRTATMYRPERYAAIVVDDLMAGNPAMPSDAFGVVVCEQALEHLPRLDLAIAALERVARPGGKVSVGVPIFIPPFALARDAWARGSLLLDPKRHWSHIQTFSQRSLLRAPSTSFATSLAVTRSRCRRFTFRSRRGGAVPFMAFGPIAAFRG